MSEEYGQRGLDKQSEKGGGVGPVVTVFGDVTGHPTGEGAGRICERMPYSAFRLLLSSHRRPEADRTNGESVSIKSPAGLVPVPLELPELPLELNGRDSADCASLTTGAGDFDDR